jgi:predicted  nucleic acid-binding Zn-ribbon protein
MKSKPFLAQDLLELFSLLSFPEDGAPRRKPSPRTARRVKEIRKKIPKVILDHFECIRLDGRKPIAPVDYAVCTACNFKMPKARALAAHRSGEIDICDNCGAFIYVEKSDRLGSE